MEMKVIKKTGIVAGALIGGVIGGTISVIGKVANRKIVDNVGESVTDSLIYFGGIAGNVASGAADVALGNMLKSTTMVDGGIDDLKDGGKMLVGNWLHNAKLVLGETGEIAKGLVHRDKGAIKKGVKTIGQIAVVGALTVGAIRLKQEDLDKESSQEDE
jgi:hypothetical protein